MDKLYTKLYHSLRAVFTTESLKKVQQKIAEPNIPLSRFREIFLFSVLKFLWPTGVPQLLVNRIKYSSDKEPRYYTYESLSRSLDSIYSLPDVKISRGRAKTCNILVPAFDFRSISAGFFGVFRLALFLRSILEYNVRIVLFDNFHFQRTTASKKLKDYEGLEDLLDILEVEYIYAKRPAELYVSPDDVSVATVWYSAYLARKIQEVTKNSKKFLYLIQDYEAAFYPCNSLHLSALKSYTFNYFGLVSSKPLYDFLIAKNIGEICSNGNSLMYFNNASSSFLMPKEQFLNEKRQQKRKRFVFYSRPMVNRNLFEIASLAIIESVNAGIVNLDEWDVIGMGLGNSKLIFSNGKSSCSLPRLTLNEYVREVSTFDVGLTLMASPHPSLVPFDLAMSGAIAVTNTYETKTSEYFRTVSRNILAGAPDPRTLVALIEEAIYLSEDHEARWVNAANTVYPSNWDDSFTSDHVSFINENFEG